MRLGRIAVLGLLVLSLVWAVPSPVESETDQMAARQAEAADAVLQQLARADRPLRLDEIQALPALGPNPWTSLTPRPNPRVAEAWRAVVAQLPDAGPQFRLPSRPPRFAESEAVGAVGGNDTPATGDLIGRLGTMNDRVRAVTINGSLSGGDVRPPFEFDCESLEDDGAIPSANDTPLTLSSTVLCGGVIGDGPFGTTSGDIDIYRLGEVWAGAFMFVEIVQIADSLDPVSEAVVGIYDAEGNLLGSDLYTGAEGEFLEVVAPADGVYYAAIAGGTELGADPFASSSGPGAAATGTYEVFLGSFVPCFSVEDDGSIPQANRTTLPLGNSFIDCSGSIGDGPFGDTSGDIDYYQLGTVEVGEQARVTVFPDGELPIVAGIYDSTGALVAEVSRTEPSDEPLLIRFEPTTTGEYYLAIAGCCELASDPFDPASGPGASSTGDYFFGVFVGEPPCESIEDDGAIPLANRSGVDAVSGFRFCSGVIGDGPFGDTTGDLDYYRIVEPGVGNSIVAEAFFEQPVVLGVYDEAGNLLGSAESIDGFVALTVEVATTGDHYVVVAGCCDLASDPFDASSGPGVVPGGFYEMFLGVQPPPCESVEDDGAIPLANDASRGFGDDELYFTQCSGVLGDGPHAATSGDLDFFATREMQAGKVLVVDFISFDDAAASDFTIGVYDSEGTLVASGTDSATPGDNNYFNVTVPETGVYHVAVTGGLPTDPFDPESGTNTTITGSYPFVFLVDITRERLDEIIGGSGEGFGTWVGRASAPAAELHRRVVRPSGAGPVAPTEAAAGMLAQARTAAEAEADARAAEGDEEPPVDVDVFLVDLRAGDVIAGGFDNARVAGVLDPDGVLRQESRFNATFIYPEKSVLRHGRRTAFDHVATVTGRHAVFVTDGVGAYEGELRVVRTGRADEPTAAQQVVYLDFDGARVAPSIFGGGEPGLETRLSPLSSFLDAWGLGPADEDAVIDAVIDSVIENIDSDLRVVDGRNGDRNRTGNRTEFDVLVLNSRDHRDPWGQPDVSRVIIGGTIDELQIPTIGIAQSIDPGNTVANETGVVLLDILSGPSDDLASLNAYDVAPGSTKTGFVGYAVGHIAAHEVGHFIGNWHTETFNEVPSLMDAGGEWASLYGVGADGVFGTDDDIKADFVEDIFNSFEGFVGTEDTAGRSVFAFSTGKRRPGPELPAVIGDRFTKANGLGVRGSQVQLLRVRPDGGPGPIVDRATTNTGGVYQFRAAPGCYIVRFTAPAGGLFAGGGTRLDTPVCVREAEVNRRIDAQLAN